MDRLFEQRDSTPTTAACPPSSVVGEHIHTLLHCGRDGRSMEPQFPLSWVEGLLVKSAGRPASFTPVDLERLFAPVAASHVLPAPRPHPAWLALARQHLKHRQVTETVGVERPLASAPQGILFVDSGCLPPTSREPRDCSTAAPGKQPPGHILSTIHVPAAYVRLATSMLLGGGKCRGQSSATGRTTFGQQPVACLREPEPGDSPASHPAPASHLRQPHRQIPEPDCARGLHSTWMPVQAPTAACDVCDRRGFAVLQRCAVRGCGIQICKECVERGHLDESTHSMVEYYCNSA